MVNNMSGVLSSTPDILQEMYLMRMKAPHNCLSANVRGVDIKIDANGMAEVPDHLADELRSHGFQNWVDAAPEPKIIEKIIEIEKPEDPNVPETPVQDEFDLLSRNGMFEYLRKHDTPAPIPQSSESLKALCRQTAERLKSGAEVR